MSVSRRRLAAILSMDVEGFSTLVEADEARTLDAVARMSERVEATVGDYGGQVFKHTGDGCLAEFASAVSAVAWAASFQRAMGGEDLEQGLRLKVRIGIVVGDVVVTEDDRFGEGVNLAARVQTLSPPGGIAISRGVFEYLAGKTDLYFTDIGERALKGLSERHRIWTWDPKVIGVRRRRRVTAPDPATHPSIAILPFENLSGDAARDGFVDGLVEEVTASLSRVREFLVIARNSAYVYKSHAVDMRTIAAELGVRYILDGSVRFAGERMRVTLGLVDGASGVQIWSERVDAQTTDMFAVQDQIAEMVAGALHPTIRQAEIERSSRKAPENLAAYDLVLRALPHLWAHRRHENPQAIALVDEALALEPGYGRALAIGAWARAQQIAYNWSADLAAERAAGRALIERAAGLIDDDPLALTAAATAIMLIDGAVERADALIDRALGIDVNHAWAWTRRGFSRTYSGRPEEAFACFERAIRLSPRDPFSFNSFIGMGLAHFACGRPREALAWTRRALAEKPGMTWPYRDVATFSAAASDLAGARDALARFTAGRPDMTARLATEAMGFMNAALRERYVDGLVAAGLPDDRAAGRRATAN
ncbi:adenylate/guanylate cyclase domain-containing protein [Aureimonas leprariae]|uniref:Tetratricopeptide repeat protein n=1 Tax=Plantimonas leprariae TaxID=2615207 RepID=A0A7V7TXP9_9HYPH|nr:adenylate/guanylate cyclase domain-containing protein [Aureimonas leprariae]KAB0681231.1 tetratricopeptide repeat protein [Aureimonas leprariae]